MPYDPRGLMPLIATSPFAVWHYRTTDSRTAVLRPGYFNAAAGQLRPGHLVILQAGDSMTFLPVREAGNVGDGLVLDTTLAPVRAIGSAAIRFGATGTATATAIPRSGSGPVVGDGVSDLLTENGDALLLENGDRLAF